VRPSPSRTWWPRSGLRAPSSESRKLKFQRKNTHATLWKAFEDPRGAPKTGAACVVGGGRSVSRKPPTPTHHHTDSAMARTMMTAPRTMRSGRGTGSDESPHPPSSRSRKASPHTASRMQWAPIQKPMMSMVRLFIPQRSSKRSGQKSNGRLWLPLLKQRERDHFPQLSLLRWWVAPREGRG